MIDTIRQFMSSHGWTALAVLAGLVVVILVIRGLWKASHDPIKENDVETRPQGEKKNLGFLRRLVTPIPIRPWTLMVIFLNLVGVGGVAYKTHLDQEVIAKELARVASVSQRTANKVAYIESDLYDDNRYLARLRGIEHRLAGLPMDWLEKNLDELNRMRLASSKHATDQDGYVDTEDDCPNIPSNGYESEYGNAPGCPESHDTDTDKDGIFAIADRCPTVAGWGLTDNYPTYLMSEDRVSPGVRESFPLQMVYNGCPDKDGDEVHDAVDLCPDVSSDSSDVNQDGCKDSDQDLGKTGDHTWLSPTPVYKEASAGLVGVFQAERNSGGVRIEFDITCQALGADGKQLPKDTKDYSLVKSWGTCLPS